MRLFTGITLSKQAQDAVSKAQETLRSAVHCSKWQSIKTLHITLHFLGECEEGRIAGIQESLRANIEKFPPFSLSIGPLGIFGRPSSPRVLWLGLQGDVSMLQDIQKHTAEVLRKLGVYDENKPYHPHLTLGREVKDDFNLSEAQQLVGEFSSVAWQVDHICLFKSELLRTGAVHTVIGEYQLQDQA
ncbi:RNA 2',3'-cyclic phosphodiesterase [Aneurinibacillus sp. Ricciae_BoGa-3]|uniref:RNA 2',3'-cyclic phosphodiesterase n=1 Tax=Aneurinibacillus sp. Ricciae_BoGa-3 TaxID=3022697 RepID=UPI00233FB7CE|nr:RNA 2',3'-cyclic phosphodiesterase [Aneurinibacillus sp. Ricciae_BoGa-3]WCK56554.1 RNA 2',3'-cyclic phosphodiesterase [Aneurinibacillus sp. Ricciae_BoGa-3]